MLRPCSWRRPPQEPLCDASIRNPQTTTVFEGALWCFFTCRLCPRARSKYFSTCLLHRIIISIRPWDSRCLIFPCKIPANSLHNLVWYEPCHRMAPLLCQGHAPPQPEVASETPNAALMIGSDDTAGLDGVAMTEMAHVRCQCLYLRCGSVRISSGVYSRLKPYLEVSGILGLIASCVNRKFVTSTRGSK